MADEIEHFDATAHLRSVGLRVTRPRIAVLDTLHSSSHLRVDQIATRVRATLGTVSHQAVYDVLHACVDAGLVHSIEPAGSPSVFELHTDDNHHHAVCRSCGNIADVTCIVGSAPCLTPSSDTEFEIDEAEVVFWGTCPRCQQTQRQKDNQPAEEAAV